MKKRLLCLMASLLLCGAVSAQAHFEVDTHAKDNNMPVVAQVVFDGVAITTGGYELGAFVGDATEARGSAQIQTGDLAGTYWIQVYYTSFGNDNETGATVTFKLYDGTDEYTAETTLDIDPEGYGTPGTPQVIVVNRAVTQTTQLALGWNWWSTPIELGNNGLEMLENSLGENGLFIKARNGMSVEYIPEDLEWWGDEFNVTNEYTYIIKTSVECQTTLRGPIADPVDHPIEISRGWNWIGYPVNYQIEINEAFASINPSEDDILQQRNGDFSIYVPGDGFWGDIEYMNPGYGYKYKSNESSGLSQTLVYPSGNRGYHNGFKPVVINSYPEANEYQYLMNIVAVVNLDGFELSEDSYEIQAFSNDQIHGRAKLRYCEHNGRYVALLTVFGDSNETIHFVVNNLDNGECYSANESLTFDSEQLIGTLKSPFTIHTNSNNITNKLRNIFPNPAKAEQTVFIGFNESNNVSAPYKIEIINTMGECVYTETSTSIPGAFKAPKSSGVYVVRLTINESIYYGNLIITK